MARLTFPHPLPAEQIPAMMDALSAGSRVAIGQVTFDVDEDATVWGTDPYGCDFIAATSLDAGRIVASADRHHDLSVPHPAEFSH